MRHFYLFNLLQKALEEIQLFFVFNHVSVCQDPQQLTITEMFQRSFDEEEMLALVDQDQ